jgi:hypothetical protein
MKIVGCDLHTRYQQIAMGGWPSIRGKSLSSANSSQAVQVPPCWTREAEEQGAGNLTQITLRWKIVPPTIDSA